MLRVLAAIAISEKPALDESIVVESLSMLDRRSGRDAERDLGQNSRLEYALGAN